MPCPEKNVHLSTLRQVRMLVLFTRSRDTVYNCNHVDNTVETVRRQLYSEAIGRLLVVEITCLSIRGVVVNFDLGARSQQPGSLRLRARRVAVLGVGSGGGRPSR